MTNLDLITTVEASSILRVDISTVRRWADEGKLKIVAHIGSVGKRLLDRAS
ncbi:hypothetical protein LCGC14_0516970 [marine sediment metagenome]|uniref:Helix-turn-helix domain-containing protein n=1 Tax=marine sediment metagenome TaxID=412755 RepID=A0A0F9V7U2_9ZZZZ